MAASDLSKLVIKFFLYKKCFRSSTKTVSFLFNSIIFNKQRLRNFQQQATIA